MDKLFLIALIFQVAFGLSAQTQPCNNYACKMDLARQALQAGRYQSALDLARGAESYDGSKKEEVNAFIDQVFGEIEGKRLEAERQRKIADQATQRANEEAEAARNEKRRADAAEQASKRAADSIAVAKRLTDVALSRSERLSQYYEFNGEKAAWAYRRGFFAVVNTSGDTLSDFVYENPEPFAAGRAWAKADNQYVLLDDTGKEISGRYDYRFGLSNGKGFWAGGRQEDYLLDTLGKEIFSVSLPDWNAQANNDGKSGHSFLKIRKDGLFGFIDRETYSVVINPAFRVIRYFKEGMAPFMNTDGKWGVMDMMEKTLIKPSFSSIEEYSEGLFRARDSKNANVYIDRYGSIAVSLRPAKRSYISASYGFSDGLALVRESDERRSMDRYYYIDHEGKKRIRLRKNTYFATPFSDSVAVVFNRKGISILDRHGKTKLMPGADYLTEFSDNLARFQRRSKWGLLDKKGRIVCNPVYDELNDFAAGFALAKKEGSWVPLDRNGRALVYHQIDLLKGFKNGVAIAVDARIGYDKLGLVNEKGQAVADFIYDNIIDNRNGTYWVAYEKKWGLLDKEGRMLIQFKYNIIESQNKKIANYPLPVKIFLWINQIKYPRKKTLKKINREFGRVTAGQGEPDEAPGHNGLLVVWANRKAGLTDTAGASVLPCLYDHLHPAAYRVSLTEQNGRLGLFAPDYGILLPCKYEQIGFAGEENGWIRVRQNDKWGWVDASGKVMIPCRFDAATPFQNGKARVMQAPYPREFMINTKGEMLLGE